VSGTTFVPGSDCDDCAVAVGLPFTYYFYGQPFSAVDVVSNGLLSFTGPADVGFANFCIPDPSPRANVIYAFWRDLTMDSELDQCLDIGCGVYTSVSGIAPNRIFNIEWRALSLSVTNPYSPVYFQVRLYEGVQQWDVIYSRLDTTDSQNATLGAQKDPEGIISVRYQCPGLPADINDGDMLTYSLAYVCPTLTPPGGPSNTPTPAGTQAPLIIDARVLLEGRPTPPSSRQSVTVTLSLRPVAGGPAVDYVTTTDERGYLQVSPNLLPGDYDWRIKNAQTLALGGRTTLMSGQNTINMGTMREGDADNNNCVAAPDFIILKLSYGKSSGQPGYDERADFTGDTAITTQDFNLLKLNFSQCGTPPLNWDTPTPTATPTLSATLPPTETPPATPTETATPGGGGATSLIGHLTIAGRSSPPSSRQSVTVSLSLRPTSGGGSPIDFTSTTDDYGYVTVTTGLGLVPGDYNWRIKNPQTLALAGAATLLPGDNQVEMGVLREGDADDNNCVTAVDFTILKVAYGKSPGQPGYDGRADFNGDSTISSPDFTLLRNNFNQCGAGPIRAPRQTIDDGR
jgi:hypothetical protein